MNQASTNSNMSRATFETLKQIQKQGLSISVVSTDKSSFALESSVSKETKPKQIVMLDKTPKLSTRSPAGIDTKTTSTQVRPLSSLTADARTASGQSVFSASQDVKMHVTKTPISSSDAKVFPPQSNAVGSEPKTPLTANRSLQAASAPEKSPNFSTRLAQASPVFQESKSQTPRPLNVVEYKNQSRVGQPLAHGEAKKAIRCQNSLTFEGKIVGNQSRLSMSSPPLPEKKALIPNHGRSSQTLSTHDSKNVLCPRSISQTPTESKSNLKRTTDMLNEVRSVLMNKVTPVAIRNRPSAKSMVEHTSGHTPPVVTERALHNPFREAATLCKKPEERCSVKVTQHSKNMSIVTENHTQMHPKLSRNVSMQTETNSISRIVKVSSAPPGQTKKPSFDSCNNSSLTPGLSAMSVARVSAVTKRAQNTKIPNSTPLAKKKCVKKSNVLDEKLDPCYSSDESPPQILNKKDLTITPVTPIAASISGAKTSRPVFNLTAGRQHQQSYLEVQPSDRSFAVCPSCHQCSRNLSACDSCNTPLPSNGKSYRESMQSIVLTENVTTKIEKKIVYQFPEAMGTNRSFQIQRAMQGKLRMQNSIIQVSPRGKGRTRRTRKSVEPVCYTLSSDDEDPVHVPYHSNFVDSPANASHYHESDGSNASENLQGENPESDDMQFPGVTDIHGHLDPEEDMEMEDMMEDEEPEEEEEVEEEEEEEEVDEDEEPEEEDLYDETKTVQEARSIRRRKNAFGFLHCRSIRIGSYKVHPFKGQPYVHAELLKDGLAFLAPTQDNSKLLRIKIVESDVIESFAHFGRCLPILFVRTTTTFANTAKDALKFTHTEVDFDPTSKDEKIRKLTFLIETLPDDHRNFLRNVFPGDRKMKEIDQKTANEILVKSTPQTSHNIHMVKLCSEPNVSPPSGHSPSVPPPSLPPEPHERIVTIQVSGSVSQNQQHPVPKCITNIPPHEVVKMLTYPPPPQTGGITVTNEDFQCLHEGELLNDAIIDFYLKYVYYEKLSPQQREKTHIFSSYFYNRLTRKPEKRQDNEPPQTMQMRRHNQVKTWTKNVDIFSKDFIIVPVNQNVHWFLAIICYPGKVVESPDAPVKVIHFPKKTTLDGVTSTDEQNTTSKVTITELCSIRQGEDQEENSDSNSYDIEDPSDTDEEDGSADAPDSSTHPDGRRRDEMPCICVFDSLAGPSRGRVANTLREYLEVEWRMRKSTYKVFDKNTMQGFNVKCPQQTNYSDCGMYLLQFVESFFENPLPYFGSPMPDLTEWFTEEKISKKRGQVKDLIKSIEKKQLQLLRRQQLSYQGDN